MTINQQTVDRVNFGQFLKTIYLNAMHCARRAQLKSSEEFEKKVVLEFMDSLYPSSLERRFTVDAEILKQIIAVLNFIQVDHFHHKMIPYHETIDRMENELTPATFQFILSRYRAMTRHYYMLGGHSLSPQTPSASGLGGHIWRVGTQPVREVCVPLDERTRMTHEEGAFPLGGRERNSLYAEHVECESLSAKDGAVRNQCEERSVDLSHRESVKAAMPDKRGRGRPKKAEQMPVVAERGLDDVVQETSVAAEEVKPPVTKKRGRPAKAKSVAEKENATVSDATVSDATVSGATVSGATVSGATVSGATVSGATVSGSTVSSVNV